MRPRLQETNEVSPASRLRLMIKLRPFPWAGIQCVCKESKGLINLADKLGRTPLLAGLMAGAGLEAVRELVVQGEDPGQEDEVGRGAPEAAILYCDNKVGGGAGSGSVTSRCDFHFEEALIIN